MKLLGWSAPQRPAREKALRRTDTRPNKAASTELSSGDETELQLQTHSDKREAAARQMRRRRNQMLCCRGYCDSRTPAAIQKLQTRHVLWELREPRQRGFSPTPPAPLGQGHGRQGRGLGRCVSGRKGQSQQAELSCVTQVNSACGKGSSQPLNPAGQSQQVGGWLPGGLEVGMCSAPFFGDFCKETVSSKVPIKKSTSRTHCARQLFAVGKIKNWVRIRAVCPIWSNIKVEWVRGPSLRTGPWAVVWETKASRQCPLRAHGEEEAHPRASNYSLSLTAGCVRLYRRARGWGLRGLGMKGRAPGSRRTERTHSRVGMNSLLSWHGFSEHFQYWFSFFFLFFCVGERKMVVQCKNIGTWLWIIGALQEIYAVCLQVYRWDKTSHQLYLTEWWTSPHGFFVQYTQLQDPDLDYLHSHTVY